MSQVIGKPVDIAEILDIFEAEEGSIQSYTGGVGEGKTYGATKRAIEDLQRGRVVYTNWQLILDHFEGDQRKDPFLLFWKLITFNKRFYNVDLKKNWHYFDMEDEETWVIGDKKYDSVVDFLANLTDCVVYLDEGQDIFDSYELTKMSKKKRKTLTRTRHLHKTLVVISQRYQAIPPTARANIKTFYRHVKAFTLFGKPFFKVYATDEIDQNHMPIFNPDDSAYQRYWGSQKIYDAYNSWYLRGGIPRSQNIFIEGYDLSLKDKVLSLIAILTFPLRRKRKEKFLGSSVGVKRETRTLKIATRDDRVVPITKIGSIQRSDGEKRGYYEPFFG